MAGAFVQATGHYGYRLPELFAGFGRIDGSFPVRYPTSSSPQAWSAGVAPLCVRAFLGLSPDLPTGKVVVQPCLAEGASLELQNVPLGPGRVSVGVRKEGEVSVELSGLPGVIE